MTLQPLINTQLQLGGLADKGNGTAPAACPGWVSWLRNFVTDAVKTAKAVCGAGLRPSTQLKLGVNGIVTLAGKRLGKLQTENDDYEPHH